MRMTPPIPSSDNDRCLYAPESMLEATRRVARLLRTRRKIAPCWGCVDPPVAAIAGIILHELSRPARYSYSEHGGRVSCGPWAGQRRRADAHRRDSTDDSAWQTTVLEHMSAPGYHTLKIWKVDPSIAIDRIVIDTGGLRPSYLGPPESYRR